MTDEDRTEDNEVPANEHSIVEPGSSDDAVPDSAALDRAVRGFRTAEKALRQFHAAAAELRTAQDGLQAAGERVEAAYTASTELLQQAYDNAIARLDLAQTGVADATSGVFRLAEELTGIARDLADATQVVRKFEPERMHNAIEALDDAQVATHRDLVALRSVHDTADQQRTAIAAALTIATRWATAATVLVIATLILVVVG